MYSCGSKGFGYASFEGFKKGKNGFVIATGALVITGGGGWDWYWGVCIYPIGCIPQLWFGNFIKHNLQGF